MSSFYSRCLSCGIDLPNGCRFCGELCRERWHEKHSGEAVAVTMTDEWPLVSGAERVVTTVNRTVDPDEGRSDRRAVSPTVALCSPDELPPSRTHGPYCGCKHCRVDVI